MVVTLRSSPAMFSAATADLTSSIVVAVTFTGAWKSAPPVNSMPQLMPRNPSAAMEIRMMTPEIRYHRLRLPTKS